MNMSVDAYPYSVGRSTFLDRPAWNASRSAFIWSIPGVLSDMLLVWFAITLPAIAFTNMSLYRPF